MDYSEITSLLKALSDENRVCIVSMIADRDDICACNILDELGITQPTLSHHMKVLCESGLVTCRKEGKWMHYSLDHPVLDKIKKYFVSLS